MYWWGKKLKICEKNTCSITVRMLLLLYLKYFLHPDECFTKMKRIAWCLDTARKVSRYRVFSVPYSVQMRENTDQKKLHIWTLFTLCWPCAVPLRVSPRVPVAFDKLRRLVLHWGHTRVIMCNGGLRRRMHKKSSLQIICTYRQSSNSGHVSDALWKT